MRSWVALIAVVVLAALSPVQGASPAGISGQYVEARTCDVWTGACFANAEMNISGKHAVLAWKIDEGRHEGVALNGLCVLAVVEATNTLGMEQTGPARAVLIVDTKASATQREALVSLAKQLGGKLTENVLAVDAQPIKFSVGHCNEGGCALVETKHARVETRCIHEDEDKVCGHEDNFYPPLTSGVSARSAMVVEHSFKGKGFDKTWNDSQRRGAFIGRFKSTN